SAATYQRLHHLANLALHAGFPVVIDATYLQQAQREQAGQIAADTGVPFLILDCHAPDSVIAGWLAQRQAAGSDPSDATLEVIQAQHSSREPLSAVEQQHAKRVDTHDAASLGGLVEQIRQRLPGL